MGMKFKNEPKPKNIKKYSAPRIYLILPIIEITNHTFDNNNTKKLSEIWLMKYLSSKVTSYVTLSMKGKIVGSRYEATVKI